MSNTPYLLPRVREGLRMGNATIVDAMIHDGLWCAFEQCHMGMSGEHVADTYKVGRADQDQYAAREPSQGGARDQARAGSRTRSSRSRSRRRRAPRSSFDRDEAIRADTTAASARRL